MAAGKLRHRLKFQKERDSQDDSGGQSVDWVDVFTIWGELLPSSSRSSESIMSGTEIATDRYTATIRYRKGINARMRVVHQGNIYKIIAAPADPTGRRKFLEIECRIDV